MLLENPLGPKKRLVETALGVVRNGKVYDVGAFSDAFRLQTQISAIKMVARQPIRRSYAAAGADDEEALIQGKYRFVR